MIFPVLFCCRDFFCLALWHDALFVREWYDSLRTVWRRVGGGMCRFFLGACWRFFCGVMVPGSSPRMTQVLFCRMTHVWGFGGKGMMLCLCGDGTILCGRCGGGMCRFFWGAARWFADGGNKKSTALCKAVPWFKSC